MRGQGKGGKGRGNRVSWVELDKEVVGGGKAQMMWKEEDRGRVQEDLLEDGMKEVWDNAEI